MIVKLTKKNLSDLHKSNQPFDIIGKLDVTFRDGKWESREILFDEVTEKQYPNYDGTEPIAYIKSDDYAAFLAYEGNECVGQILLCSTWNGYAHIEDISVARAWRGKGIGTELFAKAVEWATEHHLCGISLESQDNNVLASRFYKKNGMHIGAVNTELYSNLGLPYCAEKAIYWYKFI